MTSISRGCSGCLDRAGDHREEVVEVVGDPPGQLPDRVHLLRLANPLLGHLALGDVLDDLDQMLRLAVIVADDELGRNDGANAVAGRFQQQFAHDRLAAGSKRVRVLPGDGVGLLGGKDIVNRLADQLVAALSEQLLVGAIDQGDLLRRRLLDDDRHGGIFNDGIEEALRLRQLALGTFRYGDVLVRGDPSPAERRPGHDRNFTPVGSLGDPVRGFSRRNLGQDLEAELLGIPRQLTGCDAVPEQLPQGAAGLYDLGR